MNVRRVTTIAILLLVSLSTTVGSQAVDPPPAGATAAAGPTTPMQMSCTCAEPMRSGATMVLGAALLTILTLSASAMFGAAAVFLLRRSRVTPAP